MLMFFLLPLKAQKEKNNIYLFDCTGSMITNKLWEPAKSSLDETIKLNATIPGSHVTIIPFGDNPYPAFSFESKDYAKESKSVFNSFDKHIKEAKHTHISDVVEEGLKYIDNNKDNRLYLLTDGKPNQGDTPAKVAETISKWCSNHKNSRFFYVALTKGALDDEIRRALENCPDAFIVETQGNVIPIFADLSQNDIYTNLKELEKPREIEFNLPGNYTVTPIESDSLFDVKIMNNKAANGKILISLIPKLSLTDLHQKLHGEEYEFPLSIKSEDSRIHIVNPHISVHVADEIPSNLILAEGLDEMAVPGTKWHDSFLWSPAAKDETISWNLNPVFENELKNSALNLKFSVPASNSDDFEAWYNDKPVKNGETIILKPDEPAILKIQFNHNAKTGKRYFELVPVDYSGLNQVNSRPVEEYNGITLRTAYSTGWNPLAIVLFWIGVAILLFLILWFLFLQRLFYPRIKLGRVEFSGPGSYYQSKKLKGARKVVLTSKKKKQNVFSRIFTGEVRYVKADHFSPDLEILPGAGKKKVKVRNTVQSAEGWEIYPSSTFSQYDKGSVKSKTTNEETKLEFS